MVGVGDGWAPLPSLPPSSSWVGWLGLVVGLHGTSLSLWTSPAISGPLVISPWAFPRDEPAGAWPTQLLIVHPRGPAFFSAAWP